ncbi:helix-hairpin-helix domain-containing protein [Micromonospora sp. NPDC002717]|uniref:helix-hairpin-helix domain-containing protein n=1 Tax=Micromonospora sp. NPDC002717 TaxID=3154424 RepID=UPI0033336906
MSDDEETVVRERLRRLVTGPPSAGTPAREARFAEHTGWSPSAPAGTDPESWPGPGPGTAPAFRSAPALAPVPAGRTAPPEPDPPPGTTAATAEAATSSRLPGPGAFDPGRRGVRALAVVAVLVVLGAGFWAWRSRPQAEPVRPVATAEPPVVSATGPVEPGVSPAGELVVAVAGKVRRPGLVRVPAGARVADVVEAAGGALPGVDVALLNPARKVTDGELILVGVAAAPGATPPPGAAPGGAPGAAPGAGGRLNLNTATLAQLDALPGVGPVLAQRILDHRDQQGGFRSVGDLRQVDGIGDARYEQLKDLVTV